MKLRSVWVLYYTGKYSEAFQTKAAALADLQKRMRQYYTQRADYELVRYDASK